MNRFIVRYIATFGYTGLSPVAPGTAGSLAATALLLAAAFFLTPAVFSIVLSVGILLTIALGTPAAGAVEREEGSDPGKVVIDEAAGQWIGFLFIPSSLLLEHIWIPFAGFLLFRFFDTTKLFPANKAEQLGGGIGIMADDIVAGLYTCLILNLLVMRFAVTGA